MPDGTGKAPISPESTIFQGRFPPDFFENLGPKAPIITKGVFSLEESLESPKSLDFLKSLENGRLLLYFHSLGGFLESSKLSNISRNGLFWKEPFSKRPLFWTQTFVGRRRRLNALRGRFVSLVNLPQMGLRKRGCSSNAASRSGWQLLR